MDTKEQQLDGQVTSSPSSSKSYYTTSNPFETKFGYHRAVRKGPFIFVSGTTALKLDHELDVDDDIENDNQSSSFQSFIHDAEKKSKVHYPDDARKQAKLVMERCVNAVERLGGKIDDVVRVRMFVARHDDCLAVGEAYRDTFGGGDLHHEIGAAATMIVTQNGFVDLDILVEIEVDAVDTTYIETHD